MKFFKFLIILFSRLEHSATSAVYRNAYQRLRLDAVRALWELEREQVRNEQQTRA